MWLQGKYHLFFFEDCCHLSASRLFYIICSNYRSLFLPAETKTETVCYTTAKGVLKLNGGQDGGYGSKQKIRIKRIGQIRRDFYRDRRFFHYWWKENYVQIKGYIKQNIIKSESSTSSNTVEKINLNNNIRITDDEKDLNSEPSNNSKEEDQLM